MILRSSLFLFTAVATVATSATARADGGAVQPASLLVVGRQQPDDQPDDADAHRPDHLFPGGRHGSVGVSTGVPFLGIAEAAYAPADRVTVGAIAGVTPSVVGFGVRPRVLVYNGTRARAFIVAPTLYYPATHISNGEPWVLTNPVMHLEMPTHGWRVRGGAGLVFAACQDALLGIEHEEHFMGDVWPTIAAGASHPVGASSEMFADVQGVLPKGAAFGRDWIGGPPVVLSIGVASNL